MYGLAKGINPESLVMVSLPKARTENLESILNMSTRIKFLLGEASQDQLRLLYTLKHPGVIELTKEVKANKTET